MVVAVGGIGQGPRGQSRIDRGVQRHASVLDQGQGRHRRHRLAHRAGLEQGPGIDRGPTGGGDAIALGPGDAAAMDHRDRHARDVQRVHLATQRQLRACLVLGDHGRQQAMLDLPDLRAGAGCGARGHDVAGQAKCAEQDRWTHASLQAGGELEPRDSRGRHVRAGIRRAATTTTGPKVTGHSGQSRAGAAQRVARCSQATAPRPARTPLAKHAVSR